MVTDTVMKMRRKALEKLYTGACSVYGQGKIFNETTKETMFGDVVVFENEPCRLSFESVKTTEPIEGVAKTAQSVKLFLAPERSVAPGCKIVVTQDGVTTAYKQSGKAAVYADHQEIPLELFQGYA